jgi:hypothetical protein
MKCVTGVHEVSAVPAGEFREWYLEGTNVLKEHVYEKDGWIYWLGFFPAPQWQPTAVTDFKSVAGKWEGFLTSDDPRALHFDRATLVIDDAGAAKWR